jgi:hypothetical protein
MKLWAKVLVGVVAFSGFIILCLVFYGFYSSSSIEEMKSRTLIKSKMRDAKVILKNIVQMQTLFRARNGSYTSDLKLLGVKPKVPLVYKFGFAAPYDSANLRERFQDVDYDPSRKDSDQLFSKDYIDSSDFSHIKIADMAQFYCPRCHVDKDSFLAIAFANLDDDDTWDVWTVDEAGNLTHVISDLEASQPLGN